MIAEGRRTRVFLVSSRRGKAILKKPKGEANRASIIRERKALRYLNALGIPGVPRVYALTEEGLYEEYIEGKPLKDIKGDLLEIAKRSLTIAFLIDSAGVRHKELSLAHKHILVGDDVYIIDFGHSALGYFRRSLTQLVSFYVFKLRLFEPSEEIIEALREYKKKGTFDRILKALGL